MNKDIEYCQTCLSSDRVLTPVDAIHITFELKLTNGCICWECKSTIEKFNRFRYQVNEVQNLIKHSEEEETKLISYSRLKRELKISYDYKYNYDTDPLINNDIIIKQEIFQNYNDDFHNDSDNDKPIKASNNINENVKLKSKIKSKIKCKENIIKKTLTRTKKRLKKKLSNNKTDNNPSDKYTEMIMTEVEMMKMRNDKTSSRNFKKLPYKCDSCVLGFTKKENYEQHQAIKHSETLGKFVCSVCKSRFRTEVSMDKHKRKHFKRYKCKMCSYESVSLKPMVNHCEVKHDLDKINEIHCKQCNEVFNTPELMTLHTNAVHRQTLICNDCKQSFKYKSSLRTHIRRVHCPTRGHACPICNKAFYTPSRLESHMTRHGGGQASQLAYCTRCGIQYKNIYVYRNHLKNSAKHATDLYKCGVCEKKFVSKTYLKRHTAFFHLNKSKYKCDHCNKLFISEWSMTNHHKMHHGLKRTRDYKCTTCGKEFYTSSTLSAHVALHSPSRPYMCAQCGQSFKQRPALYTHARRLHARL